MLGLGFGEILVIALVLLIAVGPKRLPTLMKAFGRGLREFRRATRNLRDSVGIDDWLYDDPQPRRSHFNALPDLDTQPHQPAQPHQPPEAPPAEGASPSPAAPAKTSDPKENADV